MTILDAFIARGAPVPAHRPWPRVAIDVEAWRDAIAALAAGEIRLASEWGEADAVHMAIAADGDPRVAVLTLACPERRFPSVGASHAPAIRLERAIRDLFGLTPDGLPDERAWLDHGRWGVAEPLGRVLPAPSPVPAAAAYPFLAAGVHQQ